MTRQGKITILGEVGILVDTHKNLMKVASSLPPGSDANRLLEIGRQIVNICEALNDLGAPLLPQETVNPILN